MLVVSNLLRDKVNDVRLALVEIRKSNDDNDVV
jgi:hypothetical protein